MITLGYFNQKASSLLVWFVFSCIIVTIGLLYVLQKSLDVSENIVSVVSNYESVD